MTNQAPILKLQPSERLALRKAVEACVETTRPMTAQIIIGMLRDAGDDVPGLEAMLADMPTEVFGDD